MRREIWTGMEQAMMILQDGRVHPTEDFLPLVQKLASDREWSHRSRTVGMMTLLGKVLDFTNNQLRLVQLAKKGQCGLYQLQRRAFFHVPPVNQYVHEQPSSTTR